MFLLRVSERLDLFLEQVCHLLALVRRACGGPSVEVDDELEEHRIEL